MVRQNLIALTTSVILVLSLSACTSTATSPNGPKTSKTQTATDRLSSRELAVGECGIFVWTADTARRFILFSRSENPVASWWSGSEEVFITRTSAKGYSLYDQPPEQSFTLPDGGTLDVTLQEAEEITYGTRYKSGSIQLKSADGWEKVMPVIGLAGCQTAQN